MKYRRLISICAAALNFATSAPTFAFGNDVVACSVDEPCFNAAYQSGSKVIFEFNGVRGWDFYNVRYAASGGGVKQVENRSGHFTFNNVRANRKYTLNVQGCRSRALRSSVCTDWVSASVVAR